MSNIKIGISGARGSSSKKAVRKYLQEQNGKVGRHTISYLTSAKKVVSALERGVVDIGIFPTENTDDEAGYVMRNYDFSIVVVSDSVRNLKPRNTNFIVAERRTP